MAKLALFLLGPPRLERDGAPLQFDTHKIMALIAYLAVEGAHHSRASLLALLWPDLEPSRARAVLRRNLSLLRSGLEGEWLVVDGQMVSTDPEADFWLDVEQFSRLVHAGEPHDHPPEQVCPECLEALTQAVSLYRGEFLEGFGLRDSIPYDEWQFFQAEGLGQELASALSRLVGGYSAQGNPEEALVYARRWLALDPLHEPVHRQLMQLYAQAGQRSAALRQYQECIRILDEELGLAPAKETASLYEQIRTRSYGQTGLPPTKDPSRETDLPRPRTRLRHNLPAQTTPFVGREEELGEIGPQLQDPGCRLLTLLGPGGIGKTRLALRLAQDLLEAEPTPFEHGVFFVPLAPLQRAEGVVPAVAEALGYSFHTGTEGGARTAPHQQLFDYLERKQLLLVMDNYEHLLVDEAQQSGEPAGSGTDFVTGVLSSAPGVKILVTSRASLKVQGEYLYPLAGLQVPDAMQPTPAGNWQALRGYSAVELFIQGGRQVRPDFELRSQDLAHVAHICRLVQGMPLGILLAAAWVELLSPEEIATEIQNSLDFLETDVRDVPLRQRSIRAVFDHSWRLLTERERQVFQGLSVFRGGFTREAAEEIIGASLYDLMSLINKSLLHRPAPGRYELHELLRQVGAERLEQAQQQGKAVRDRHCTYYSSALETWAAELRGARQRQALDEMDLEIENGRAAWLWAVAQGHESRLAQSVDGIWLYHARRLRHQEGEATLQAAVDALQAMDSYEAQRLRAQCLIINSEFHLNQGKFPQPVKSMKQGVALLKGLEMAGQDVRHEMALAKFQDARIKRYTHSDPLEAQRSYEQSAALYKEVGDRWGLARALAYLGWVAEHLGHFGPARELCEKSLAIRQELGDQFGIADAMMNLGIISWVQGQLDEAHQLLRESMGIFGSLDDWVRVAYATKSMGEVLVRRGLFEDGLAVIESSADIYDDLGYNYGVWGLFPFLAEAKLHLGRYQEAHEQASQGISGADKVKHRWGVGFAQFVSGLAVLAPGTQGDALTLFQKAVAAFEEVRQRENRGWALGPLGLAARETGETALARQSVVKALEIGLELGAFMPVIYGLPAAALLLADQGKLERAVEAYACASRYGFVDNSRWFEDVVGQQYRRLTSSLPAETIRAAQEQGQVQDWDVMAAKVLIEL